MPTYEYRCKDCGEHLEIVQSFTDDALTVCPACGGNLRKVFGNIGITFKGSGFYKTDSRKTAASTSSKSEPGSSDTGSSTETKPSTSSDTSSSKSVSSDGGSSSGSSSSTGKGKGSSTPASKTA